VIPCGSISAHLRRHPGKTAGGGLLGRLTFRRPRRTMREGGRLLVFPACTLISLIWIAVLSVFWGPQAVAQGANFPNRAIRIIMPFPPGTAPDVALRMLAAQLSERWKQPLIVENKPGASSIIGTDTVAKAPADGYTLLATITLLAQNHSLRKDLPYDTFRDLVPITQIQREQLVLYVRGDSAVRNIAELISRANAHPGKINFATWGAGSTAHLILEKFRHDKGVQMTQVPYKGAAEIANAVVSGVVDVGIGDILSSKPFFDSGQLRPIAVTGPSRAPTLSTVETLAEVGLYGFEQYNWVGLFAPARTSSAIVRKISDAVNETASDPAYAKRLTDKMFAIPSFTTPEQFAEIFAHDTARWAAIIQATGVNVP